MGNMSITDRQLERMVEWMKAATLKRRKHYIEKCLTFWNPKEWYKCPDCGDRFPCYYDGHDCKCGKIGLCPACAKEGHASH